MAEKQAPASEAASFSGNGEESLGNLLVKEGLLTSQQLKAALSEQTKTHERLDKIVVDKGYIQQSQMGKMLQLEYGVPYISLKDIEISSEILALIPEHVGRHYKVLPVKKEGNQLFVAMADPLNLETRDVLKLVTRLEILPMVSSPLEIDSTLTRCYSLQQVVQEAVDEVLVWKPTEEEEQEAEEAAAAEVLHTGMDDAPIVRLVNTIMVSAIHSGASDVHLEPHESGLRVRFRVDGLLLESMQIPAGAKGPILSRIKVMANLDISEKRRPQDGRISIQMESKVYDLRVSTLSTADGEKIAIRILDKNKMLLSLEQLGLFQDELDVMERIIRRPYGIILFSGPSGAGKTTSLYAILQRLNHPSRNIVTIEDPVEYRLPGVNHIQVNPRAGLTFATGLRTILRQDPDIIMVGEIRDSETAKIAMESGLTGHLVLTTIHTNDAASAVTRLIDMDIDSYLISTGLLGVVAQRLVRNNCPYCTEEAPLTPEEINVLKAIKSDRKTLPRGKGCKHCMNTGCKGRSAIFEIMEVNSSIRNLIFARESADSIRNHAVAMGMSLLYPSAIRRLNDGTTTLPEIERVINREE